MTAPGVSRAGSRLRAITGCIYLWLAGPKRLVEEIRACPTGLSPRPIMKKALAALLVPLTVIACAGDTASDGDTGGADEGGTVTIITPMNGGLINGTEISVTLATTVQLLPAGDLTEGTGHHHLYLDADLTPAGQPVPSVPGSIIHMGDASRSYTFENIQPGEHRLIAVVADGVHVPLQPWVVDTVTFTVGSN